MPMLCFEQQRQVQGLRQRHGDQPDEAERCHYEITGLAPLHKHKQPWSNFGRSLRGPCLLHISEHAILRKADDSSKTVRQLRSVSSILSILATAASIFGSAARGENNGPE
ncbi:hypothetical protein CI102_8978 [Trichoderma harzianum]|nr:hypothetical protein CI102_8978 [Trichoderma harzianum]